MSEIESGQTPFLADSTIQIYEKVNSCQPTYNWKIKANLRDLLEKIFVSDPDQRLSL